MRLVDDNIEEWKISLDKKAREIIGYDDDFSKCLTDEQWIEDCYGMTPIEVILEEARACL